MTALSQWPLTDEAKSGYYAMQLASHGLGSAQLLYDFSQLPPLYIWLEGLFFKLFGVSLFSLWCFPAVLSLLTVAVFYLGARIHFSKSFALVLAGLMAFCFWPLYAGRFSHQGSLLLLWECLAFWMAGKLKTSNFYREAAKKERLWDRSAKAKHNAGTIKSFSFFLRVLRGFAVNPYGFYLGLLAGAGFYTFTSWPSVALVLALWVFCFHRRSFGPFLGGMILVYLPLGIAWLRNSYGGYIQHVWALNPGEAWGPQLLRCFWDFSALFWKSAVPPNLFAYKPFWGGYLNPLLGACFFLGMAVLIRYGSISWSRFWTAAFILFYFPGFLTGGIEMFRILPLLPLLLGGAALGLWALLSSLKVSWRWPVLGLFLLASLGLDSHHLFRAYRDIWTTPHDNWFASKSVDRLRAYDVLKDAQKAAGPGLVLSSLVPDLYDQSLSIATYEFNAAENPRLNSQVRWAAILINSHYQPCLAKDFPEARWVRLAADMGWSDGGFMLGVVPLPCSNPRRLIRLIQADQASQSLVPLVFDYRDYKSRRPVVDKLGSLYPLFKGDPFLESCYWEKIADNAYGDHNFDAQIEALQQAIEKGCHAAHLYNDLGTLYLRRSRFKEARKAFEKALHCEPNYTSAAAGLRMLDEIEKTGQLPKD
ncbi:MAG TPA: glycosyltransferase family 39 protein [bacterium]|nr:glycosyltransferase family 39 protein [bacterium]